MGRQSPERYVTRLHSTGLIRARAGANTQLSEDTGSVGSGAGRPEFKSRLLYSKPPADLCPLRVESSSSASLAGAGGLGAVCCLQALALLSQRRDPSVRLTAVRVDSRHIPAKICIHLLRLL